MMMTKKFSFPEETLGILKTRIPKVPGLEQSRAGCNSTLAEFESDHSCIYKFSLKFTMQPSTNVDNLATKSVGHDHF